MCSSGIVGSDWPNVQKQKIEEDREQLVVSIYNKGRIDKEEEGQLAFKNHYNEQNIIAY